MADSEYTDDEMDYESPSSQAIVFDAFLAPFRALFSRTALRIYLNIFLFTIATLALLGVSGIAYAIFYLRFIPTVGIDQNVHLQFGDGHPWGTVSLEPDFVHSQPYDVAVVLEVPPTPSNLDVGNFMVDLTLLAPPSGSGLAAVSNKPNPIHHSRRPAILTYTSPLVDVARRVLRLPLYMVGWQREAQILEVPMMEKIEFRRGTRNLPQSLRLELQSDGKMQIYSVQVEFRARFTGMRWFMYRWKIMSFMIFSSMFWTISLGSASLTWFIVSSIWQSGTPKEELKEDSDDDLKNDTETEETSSLDEVVKVKDEEVDTKLLQSYPETGIEAVGSGLESAEGRGIQKRRMHSLEEDQ